MNTLTKHILFICFVLFSTLPSFAHQVSTSFLQLDKEQSEIAVTWDAAVKDLDVMYGLDTDANGSVTWGEVVALEEQLQQKAADLISLLGGESACRVIATEPLLVRERSFGTYLVFRWKVSCPALRDTVGVTYDFLREVDPGHAVFVTVRAGGHVASAVMSPSSRQFQFPRNQSSPTEALLSYLGHGIHHILFGFDHLAFLVVLLIPTVLPKQSKDPAPGFWGVCKSVALVVTAFTVAHSITLVLAVLHIVSLPSYIVEAAVAFSIFFSASLNVFGAKGTVRVSVAFIFGLLHGFGFATILLEESLPTGALATALLGFNLGVETGQLGVVFLILPLLFFLSRSKSYDIFVLRGVSALFACVGMFWFIERLGCCQ